MTCQCRSMSRTFCASMIQRLVSHAHGQSGSNQKSTRARTGELCTASVILGISSTLRVRSARTRWPVPIPGRTFLFPPWLTRHRSDERRHVPSSWEAACVAVPNLTRAEAAARAELLAVESYDLQLDVTDGAGHPGADTFASTTTIEFACRRPG